MKKTIFALFALAFVIAALAGGTAFLLEQKKLAETGRLASQAEDKLNAKSYDQAISMLRKVEADGGTDRSKFLLGRAFTEQGKYDDANRYFNTLLEKYPDSSFVPQARLALARYYLDVKKDQEAAQQHLLTILSKYGKTDSADHALVLLAKISLEKKDEQQARKNLELVLRKKESPAKSDAEFLIGDLNMKRLKSSEAAPGDEVYTIKAGDTLYELERDLNVPADLLAGINDLNPSALSIGTRIRVPRLEIALVVDKAARTLTVRNGNDFLKKYKVGINQDDAEMPEGKYTVSKKYPKGLEWVNPETNETVKAGEPENPYGEKFIELRRGFGIHGTFETDKIGALVSHGYIVMSNQDVAEVYALVEEKKTPVTIKGSANPEKTPGS